MWNFIFPIPYTVYSFISLKSQPITLSFRPPYFPETACLIHSCFTDILFVLTAQFISQPTYIYIFQRLSSICLISLPTNLTFRLAFQPTVKWGQMGKNEDKWGQMRWRWGKWGKWGQNQGGYNSNLCGFITIASSNRIQGICSKWDV